VSVASPAIAIHRNLSHFDSRLLISRKLLPLARISFTLFLVCLTSLTGGGRSVGIVRVRTKAMEFSFSLVSCCVHKNALKGAEFSRYSWPFDSFPQM